MGAKGYNKWANYVPLILEMYEDRYMSVEDITKITGVPSSTVSRILKNKGIDPRSQGYPKGRKKKK